MKVDVPGRILIFLRDFNTWLRKRFIIGKVSAGGTNASDGSMADDGFKWRDISC
jgi:hypothetical protein